MKTTITIVFLLAGAGSALGQTAFPISETCTAIWSGTAATIRLAVSIKDHKTTVLSEACQRNLRPQTSEDQTQSR